LYIGPDNYDHYYAGMRTSQADIEKCALAVSLSFFWTGNDTEYGPVRELFI